MTKCCSRCKQVLNLNMFNKHGTLVDGTTKYQAYCKECNKVRSRQYYAENKPKHLKTIKKLRKKLLAEVRQKLFEYLQLHPCVKCNNSDVRVLEFDHITGKKKNNVSTMIQRGNSWNTILKEIDKCQVLCANCHRIKTNESIDSYRNNWAP